MHAQETAQITDIASTELATARSDSPENLALKRHAHLIAIIKDIVLEDHAFATLNLLDVTALLHNAPTLALVLVPALICHAFAILVGLVKIVHFVLVQMIALQEEFATMQLAIANLDTLEQIAQLVPAPTNVLVKENVLTGPVFVMLDLWEMTVH
jgi:hypothetical protein